MTNAAQDLTLAASRPPAVLIPRLHEEPDGIPYYDEELGVPQNSAHRVMVHELSSILASLAAEVGLQLLSDEPIWYIHPERDEQRVFYGDCVLADRDDRKTLTARAVRIAIEVVTTHDRRKELKDTRFQRLLNEYNAVPEFVMLFPDLEDQRALTWCRLVDGRYEELNLAPGGAVTSETVPGLELRVLPRERWEPGRKVEVFYCGVPRLNLDGERQRADEERQRADEERQRADEAQRLGEEARLRAERLEARLRELGIDPDA